MPSKGAFLGQIGEPRKKLGRTSEKFAGAAEIHQFKDGVLEGT